MNWFQFVWKVNLYCYIIYSRQINLAVPCRQRKGKHFDCWLLLFFINNLQRCIESWKYKVYFRHDPITVRYKIENGNGLLFYNLGMRVIIIIIGHFIALLRVRPLVFFFVAKYSCTFVFLLYNKCIIPQYINWMFCQIFKGYCTFCPSTSGAKGTFFI